jgi:hypothetical protein
MTNVLRRITVIVLAGHALIHLLGAAKGLGWAEVDQLEQPIGSAAGVLWLMSCLLLLATATLLATGPPTWWWALAGGAVLLSQWAIVMSWSDAKAGTVINVLLALGAAYAFAAVGPMSYHAQWLDHATHAVSDVEPGGSDVTEADLATLPAPLAAYVRRSGAVGQPRVTSFHAEIHGRIRGGPDAEWMPFTGKQVNTFGEHPRRAFIIDATRSGLPVTVVHLYDDGTATMRAKVLAVATVVDASGPEMDRGETVTVFNDLVVLAPGAIVDAPVQWTAIDAEHVKGELTVHDQSVTAILSFSPEHDLVDFDSQDRYRASADGASFVRQGWSTPVGTHRVMQGYRLPTVGEGRWNAPQPEGPFTYVELHLDAIHYNVEASAVRAVAGGAGRASTIRR